MSKFEESNFYKALQDFFINADKKTFLQFLAEFYNRTEGIIDKDNVQDDLIKELRELYLEFNEKGIDENIVREKVNYFLENSQKIKDINTKLNINTNNIKNNYNETFNQIRTNTSYKLYSSPVVTIIVDDGNTEFLTLVKPIFDEYNIKASIGVIPEKVGTVGYMTLDQLKELQSNGYSILSHSFSHSENIYKPAVVDKKPISDEVILEDYRKCYEYMVNNNFNGADTIVYPWGYFTDSSRYKNLARTYFNNGVNAYGGKTDSLNTYGDGVNEEINDNMYLNRLFINKNTDIQAYKNAIDNASSIGGWLILGIHSNTNEIETLHLKTIIEYIKSKSMLILPFNESNRLKGNAINIGDFTNPYKFFVSKRGNTSDKKFTSNGENGYTNPISIIKNSNNIINGHIRLQNNTGTGVFTNQLKIGTIINLRGLTDSIIVPCIITTWDSKVISTACSLNPSGNNITINCHGSLDNQNIWRIDLNFSFII